MTQPDPRLCDLPPLPANHGDEPVFAAPWQAQLFAMTTALNEAGHFAWSEWAEQFGAELARTPQATGQCVSDHYFGCWLVAFESFVEQRGLAAAGQLSELQRRWDAAARATPHGEPIVLPAD